MSDFLTDDTRKMLAESFGIPANDPRMDAALKTLAMAKRDTQIYELSGKVDTVDIAMRYGITRQMANRIIKEQLLMRRAG